MSVKCIAANAQNLKSKAQKTVCLRESDRF